MLRRCQAVIQLLLKSVLPATAIIAVAPLAIVSGGIFLAAWIGQFVGHDVLASQIGRC